ncbi:hypothetical protein [Microvirga yunnanensis]|uniref:hypothetical protein n=1 Tax=Microvirga yunnanensis TaxID=2953740 RepID=UPI0021C7242C|nr:hypothetical protein [Microvirga sp. HBU65207]
MPLTSITRRASALALPCPWYPADLLLQLQSTLAALAELDVRHQIHQKQLHGWAGPKAIKMRYAAQLSERYQRERTPYVQRPTELQHLMDQMTFRY